MSTYKTRDELDAVLSSFCAAHGCPSPLSGAQWPDDMKNDLKARLKATVRLAENVSRSSYDYQAARRVCDLSRKWWRENKEGELFTPDEEQSINDSRPSDPGTPPSSGGAGSGKPSPSGPMIGKHTPVE
jgi:hypothetical protein